MSLWPLLRRKGGGHLCRTRYCSGFAGNAAGNTLRVCIVGTGPSGFYTAKYLLKARPDTTVDLLDKLPTPFGLVRSGVAPDHLDVKSVMNDFTDVAKDERVSFLGNVSVGENQDISLPDLRSCYDAVVLAYGSEEDRRLGLDGEEELDNVTSARAFVNWYNGHPDFRDFKPNLETKDVVIIGNGNVAIDCARILCKTPTELSGSDIAQHAMDALAHSKVERVHVVGRRGHCQSAFTTKELRELTKLEAAAFVVDPEELKLGLTAATKEELGGIGGRAAKRQAKILETAAKKDVDARKPKRLLLRFLASPVALVPEKEKEAHDIIGDDCRHSSRIGSVILERNRLEGAANAQRAVAMAGEAHEELPCGMLLRSIGYRSVPLDPSLPFDTQRHVVLNDLGRVRGEVGLYCAGWLKRGPEGIIGTNIVDARQTVAMLLEDVEQGAVEPSLSSSTGPTTTTAGDDCTSLDAVRRLIESGPSGKGADELVTWSDYERIDAYETKMGEAAGKPREKMTSVDEMLAVAHAD